MSSANPGALTTIFDEKTPFSSSIYVILSYDTDTTFSLAPRREGSLIMILLLVTKMVSRPVMEPPGLCFDCLAIISTINSMLYLFNQN